MSEPDRTETTPVCPVCDEEIEDGDGTYEGDTLYHFICCPPDEIVDATA